MEVTFKDWFGVDEYDITNLRHAAWIGRRPVAAMWVLQHQSGFKPFINIFKLKTMVTINLGRI